MNIIAPFPRAERRRIEKAIHKSTCKHHVRRLTAVLMLAKNHNITTVSTLLAAGRSSVKRWCNWYAEAGLDGLKSLTPGRKATLPKSEILAMLRMLIELNPQELGYQRARWSTELLTLEINRIFSCDIHSSTIRRWLPEAGLVWRRAAPTLHIKDPHKEEKLQKIQESLAQCDAKNPVFYEDEVDIHLNPKLGADWTVKGVQKRVATPGKNEKYYLAGALHSKTGQVYYVGSNSKDSELFIAMLQKLKRHYRRAKSITLVLDNYVIHKSRKVQIYLAENKKFKLLFQPVYSPWVNKIEKLWHALHETITRNHRCKNMQQLLQGVRGFLDNVSPYPGSGYGSAKMEQY